MRSRTCQSRVDLATAAPYLGLAHPAHRKRGFSSCRKSFFSGETPSPRSKSARSGGTHSLVPLRLYRVSPHLVGRNRDRFRTLRTACGGASGKTTRSDQIYPRKPSDPAGPCLVDRRIGRTIAPEVPPAQVPAARAVADRPSPDQSPFPQKMIATWPGSWPKTEVPRDPDARRSARALDIVGWNGHRDRRARRDRLRPGDRARTL